MVEAVKFVTDNLLNKAIRVSCHFEDRRKQGKSPALALRFFIHDNRMLAERAFYLYRNCFFDLRVHPFS